MCILAFFTGTYTKIHMDFTVMERVYIYTMLIYTCNIYLNKQHFIVFVYFNMLLNIIKLPNIIFKLSCHGPRISSSGMCNRFF